MKIIRLQLGWVCPLLFVSVAYSAEPDPSIESTQPNSTDARTAPETIPALKTPPTADEAANEASEEDEVITVTGTRTPMRRSENPILTEVITRHDLEQMGVNHIGDVLSLTGGVQITRSYAGAGATLQGLDEKHTLILVDGDRVLGEKDGVTDLSRINLDQVERVEIVRGAASALYGADAMGGVINIITRKTPKAFKASSQIGYGTDDAKEATARIGGGIGDVRLSLSGGLYLLPRFDLTPNDGNLTTHGSEMNDWHLDAKSEWKPSRRFSLTLGSRYESRSRKAIEENDSGGIFDRQQKGDFYDINLKSKYRSESGIRTSGSIRASYLRDQFVLDQRGSDVKDKYENSLLTLYQTSIQTDVPLPKNHLLSVGIDGIAESIDSPRVSTSDGCDESDKDCQYATRQRGAVFAQDSYTPLVDPYLTIVVGTRGEYDSNFGFVNVPRIAVRYDPVESIKLRASVGRGYRAPTFKELYLQFDNPSVGYTVRGNPDLEPEESMSYQVSADWQAMPLLSMNITGFRNDVDNLINFEQLESASAMNALDRYRLTNVSSAYTQGIQSEMVIGIPRITELRGGYQWLDTFDEETKRPLMNRAEHQAHGSLQLAHRESGLSITTSLVWIGARYFYAAEEDEEEDIIVVNTYRAKPFTNVSTNVRWKAARWFGVFARGENLLDAGNPVYSSQRPRRFVVGLNIGN